jgi:hypothetical protein
VLNQKNKGKAGKKINGMNKNLHYIRNASIGFLDTSPGDKIVASDGAGHVAARILWGRDCSFSPPHRLDVEEEDGRL